MPTTVDRKLKVFLCHAKADKPTVRDLYRQLTAEGWLDVWLDEMKLPLRQNPFTSVYPFHNPLETSTAS